MNLEDQVWTWLNHALGAASQRQVLSFSHACATEALNVFARAGVLIVLGFALSKAFGKWGAPVRSCILRVTLVAVALCPLLSLGLRSASLEYEVGRLPMAAPIYETVSREAVPEVIRQDAMPVDDHRGVTEFAPPAPTASSAPDVVSSSATPPRAEAGAQNTTESQTPPRNDSRRARLPLVYVVVTLAWGTISAALLTRLALAYFWMRGTRRGAAPVAPEIEEACRRAADEMKVRCPSVRMSARIASPCLVGVWRPAILLPESEASETPERLRTVFIHELAHLARRDCAWKLLAELVGAALFFQPLTRWLARQLEKLTDDIADDYVVHYSAAREPYARQLADIAERYHPGRLERTAGMGVVAFKSSLGRRVQRILDRTRTFSLRMHTGALAVIVVLGVCATTAAALIGCGPGNETAPDMSGPLFQVRWVAKGDQPGEAEDIVGRKHEGDPAKTYRVLKEVLFDDSDVLSARVIHRPKFPAPEIAIRLNGDVAKRVKVATRLRIGYQVAIVAGGEVISAPTVQGPVGENSQITGFSEEEAEDLARKLNARAKYRKAHPETQEKTSGAASAEERFGDGTNAGSDRVVALAASDQSGTGEVKIGVDAPPRRRPSNPQEEIQELEGESFQTSLELLADDCKLNYMMRELGSDGKAYKSGESGFFSSITNSLRFIKVFHELAHDGTGANTAALLKQYEKDVDEFDYLKSHNSVGGVSKQLTTVGGINGYLETRPSEHANSLGFRMAAEQLLIGEFALRDGLGPVLDALDLQQDTLFANWSGAAYVVDRILTAPEAIGMPLQVDITKEYVAWKESQAASSYRNYDIPVKDFFRRRIRKFPTPKDGWALPRAGAWLMAPVAPTMDAEVIEVPFNFEEGDLWSIGDAPLALRTVIDFGRRFRDADPARAKYRTAQSAAAQSRFDGRFQFRWVLKAEESSPFDELPGRAEGAKPPVTYRVSRDVLMDESGVVGVQVLDGSGSVNILGVGLQFGSDASERLSKATLENKGRQLAIVVNGEVVSAPTVEGTISVNAQIVLPTLAEAEAFAKALRERIDARVDTFRSPPQGVVRDAGGKAVAGAMVMLIPSGATLTRSSLGKDTFDDSRRKAGIPDNYVVSTDSAGQFALPEVKVPYLLVIESDSGYVRLTGEELKRSSDITLKPWARVKGVVSGATGPLSGELIVADAPQAIISVGRKGREEVTLSYGPGARTNERGEYSIDRIIEGIVRLQRTNPEGTDEIIPARVTVTTKAGETIKVDLGAPVCDVSGRVALDRSAQKIDLSTVRMSLTLDPNAFNEGRTKGLGREKSLQLSEMFLDFMESSRGSVYSRDDVPVGADGKFVIHGVPAGRFYAGTVVYPVDADERVIHGPRVGGGTAFSVPISSGAMDMGEVTLYDMGHPLAFVGKGFFSIGKPTYCSMLVGPAEHPDSAATAPWGPQMVRGSIVTFRKKPDGALTASVELSALSLPKHTWRVTVTRRRPDDTVFGEYSSTFTTSGESDSAGAGKWTRVVVDIDCPGWLASASGNRSLELKVLPAD